MTTLDEVTFNGPVALHGRLMREILRDKPVPRTDGTLGPAWELHLHAEWACVVAKDGEDTALVPLQHVRSMTLRGVGQVTSAELPERQVHVRQDDPAETARRALVGPGLGTSSSPRVRGRTKRLGVVPE